MLKDQIEKHNGIAEEVARTIVHDTCNTGKLKKEYIEDGTKKLATTGNAYDIEIEIKVLDENPNKKTAQVESDKIGENTTITYFTSQIFDDMEKNGGVKLLKEGDVITVKIKNTNITMFQMLKNTLYTFVGNDTVQIQTIVSGTSSANGK